MAARIDDLMVLGQNISKIDLAKYLRDREAVLPRDFGGLGDGAANDRAAIQACFDRAAADGKLAVIPTGTWNVDAGVTLGGGARGHDKIHPFEVKALKADHPVMQGVPATFTVEDELYYVNYYPNGMCEAYEIEIGDDENHVARIKVDAVTGKAKVERE